MHAYVCAFVCVCVCVCVCARERARVCVCKELVHYHYTLVIFEVLMDTFLLILKSVVCSL